MISRYHLLIFLTIALPWSIHAQETALSRAKASYQQQVAVHEKTFQTEKARLDEKFIRGLNSLDRYYSGKGQLEWVILVRKLRKSFSDTPTLTENQIAEEPAELKSAGEKYLAAVDRIRLETDRDIATVARAYVTYLKKQQVKLTRLDRIEDALAAKEELDRIGEQVDFSVLEVVETKAATPTAAAAVGELVAWGTFYDGRPVELPKKTTGYVAVSATAHRWIALTADG
ncbi:MAG: hypothetical protein AAF492_19420, partial [Verrucomicrobiota bacterium]